MRESSGDLRTEEDYVDTFNNATTAQRKKGMKGFHLDQGFFYRLSASSSSDSYFQFQKHGPHTGTPPCSLHTFLSNGLVKQVLGFMFHCIHKNGYYSPEEKIEDIHEMIQMEQIPVSTKKK